MAAFGGFLAAIGFTLALMEIADTGYALTGWDMLRGKYQGTDISDDITFWRYFPFITAILGIVAVVLEALVCFGKSAMKPIVFAVGVVTLIMAVMVLAGSTGTALFENDIGDTDLHRRFGAYFMLYGGLFTAVCGLLDFRGVKSPL